MATVAEHFPEATDYLDVYDRAGGLGHKALFAHSIHLSDREVALRITHDADPDTGVHRVSWIESNDELPKTTIGKALSMAECTSTSVAC